MSRRRIRGGNIEGDGREEEKDASIRVIGGGAAGDGSVWVVVGGCRRRPSSC